MKLLQLTLFLLFWMPSLMAQCTSKILDCHSIEASIIDKAVVKNSVYSYTLEQEILDGVWKSIAKSATIKKKIIFTSLKQGSNYRVTCILDKAQKSTAFTKLSNYETELRKETDGFVSNTVSLNQCEDKGTDRKRPLSSRNNNSEIVIFPNPASNFVNISKFKGENNILRFYDLHGKSVLVKKVASDDAKIDVSSLPRGVYFLRIEQDKVSVSNHKITIL